ncbi:MAG: hypothetical protein RL454_809 [Actinomycetota bacterium]
MNQDLAGFRSVDCLNDALLNCAALGGIDVVQTTFIIEGDLYPAFTSLTRSEADAIIQDVVTLNLIAESEL